MLQNIVFQDNLYQLARSIENTSEGLALELSREYFHDKIVNDILFFDNLIQQIYVRIQKNKQLADYLSVMQSLHSCQNKFIKLVDVILQRKTPMRDAFVETVPKLTLIKKRQLEILKECRESIIKTEKPGDSRDIVSSSELSELLKFQ